MNFGKIAQSTQIESSASSRDNRGSHMNYMAMLISVSLVLGWTPAYTAQLRIWASGSHGVPVDTQLLQVLNAAIHRGMCRLH